ncbi:MAG TPA: HAMP domain-containing sensor histidine kinase [Puia sp.]|nr:HAMP domain-containing sensor histidine kinase [Puia sp.]
MSKTLQQKNTRYFLIWLPVVLLAATALFYVLMSAHAHHMEKEQLELKQENIWNTLLANREALASHITGEYDLLPGTAVPARLLRTQRDTTIYYPASKEWMAFKLLTEQRKVRGQTYQLTTYVSSKEITHLIIKVFIAEVFVFILLLAAIVIINRKSSGLLWRPFYTSMKKINDYDITQNHSLSLTEQTGIREFDQLNQVITQLIGNVSLAYGNQKQFVENAAHELQTPLAIIRSKLELLINSPQLTEETANLLADITEANDRLSQMNRNLLLLTKIDNHQFPQQSSVNLSHTLEKLVAYYKDYYDGGPLDIQSSIQPHISLRVNVSLIEILLNNLINNAFIHNIPNGYIRVSLDSHALTIENTGHPIEGGTERLFERFKKGREQSTTTGLGLSLVQRICLIYHFPLQYTYSQNIHRITISFGPA